MQNSLTLAITKIGDLLLEKKLSRDVNGKSIEGVELIIPEYQRPYKWTAKNANQLLDDILGAKAENKEVYRVGTLILHREKGVYNIVDGQQRTITFSLLLKAFGEDVPFLRQELSDNSFNAHNIPNNLRAFERRIMQLKTENERADIRDYIKNNCELIVVVTDNLSEAFQFFDSQNARGKSLYPHDLLKAYHLREMSELDVAETESVVKLWEDMDQSNLSALFGDYLYRIKEWVKGAKSYELNEHNIDIFKGISLKDNYPYAQFYKGAFSYADSINNSTVPFVIGSRHLSPFQLDAPIIAGKPFFEYAKHYFDILADIRNNDKYEGYFINDNNIVSTLNLSQNKNGVGNGITRLLFDTAILLYVDRFCPGEPSGLDLELLDQYVIFAFVWAYSLRAQYQNVGWQSAQNYVIGDGSIVNSFNIYKVIAESDSPLALFSVLSDRVVPLPRSAIVNKRALQGLDEPDAKDENGVYKHYIHYFNENKLLGE